MIFVQGVQPFHQKFVLLYNLFIHYNYFFYKKVGQVGQSITVSHFGGVVGG